MCELVDEALFPTKKPKVKEVICEFRGKAGMAGANCKDDNTRSNSRCSDRLIGKNGEGVAVEKIEVDAEKPGEREGMVDSATSMDMDVDLFTDQCVRDERTDMVYEEGEDGLLCLVDPKEKTESRSKLKVPLKIEQSDFEVFCLGRSFGTQDYIGQRILQVATILRNLSFGEENVSTLARNVPFLRFLLLCAGSQWNCLHQMGLDMLGNVASEVFLEDPTSDRLATNLLSTITRGLHSQVSCV